MQDELAKFPVDEETEMLEQKEEVDLSGEIHLERAVFVEWLDKGQQEPQRTPCAVALMQLSIDKQSMDLRGAVSGDTAWELCCRILSKQDDAKTMGTRELAQLLVYNLEEHQLPLEMGTAIYDGMHEDLQKRGKTIEAQDDEQAMKSRWVKQLLHQELDSTRTAWLGNAADMHLDLDIEGEIHEVPHLSVIDETEQEAAKLIDGFRTGVAQNAGHETSCSANAMQNPILYEGIPWDDWYHDCEDIEEYDSQDAWEGIEDEDVHDPAAELGRTAVRGLIEPIINDAVGLTSNAHGPLRDLHGCGQVENEVARGTSSEAFPGVSLSTANEADATSGTTTAASHNISLPPDRPLVDPPEFAALIKDTDKQPYWIPGAFPTIFQNETGDPYNYALKEVDLTTWGPHVLRSKGWHAQAHMTFMYWWMNMIQRVQALSAKKWYIRDNPDATGYTVNDLSKMSVASLSKQMTGYTANVPGTKASKARLRRVILAMVRQIEIETRSCDPSSDQVPGSHSLGDVTIPQLMHASKGGNNLVLVKAKASNKLDVSSDSSTGRSGVFTKHLLAFDLAVRIP